MNELSIPAPNAISSRQPEGPGSRGKVIPISFAGTVPVTDQLHFGAAEDNNPAERGLLRKILYIISFKWVLDGIVFAFKNIFNIGEDTYKKVRERAERLARELDAERDKLAEATEQLKVVPEEVLKANGSFRELAHRRRVALLEKLAVLHQNEAAPPAITLPDRMKGLIPMKADDSMKSRTTADRSPLITKKLLSKAARGNFSLEIPVESDIKFKKSPYAPLNLQDEAIRDKLDNKQREAQISIHDGIGWSREKTMRDILKNFADGHGGTLEGVKIDIGPKENGIYTVRISGKGEYSHKMLEGISRTDKQDDERKVGKFGEGTKMAAMIMLRDKLAESIAFRSSDWRYEFAIEDVNIDDDVSSELVRKLTHEQQIEGNTVEFTTKDPEVLKALIRAVDYFYHPGNPDFMNPTFENDTFGFKFHGLKETGNLYIVNQRNDYKSCTGKKSLENACEQVTFWTKAKLDSKKTAEGRDRSEIDYWELDSEIFSHPRLFGTLSDQDLVNLIFTLKPLWNNAEVQRTLGLSKDDIDQSAGRLMLSKLVNLASYRGIGLDLTKEEREHYLADDLSDSDEVRQILRRNGFILVPSRFREIGFTSARDYWKKRSAHKPVEPSKNDIIRMNVLKEVARLYAESSEKNLPMDRARLEAQIDKPLFLFDGTDKEHEKHEENTLGEYADTHVWIERNHLRREDFNDAVATYLHEIVHNIGNGHDTPFAYAITKWMAAMQAAVVDGPEAWARWQRLQDLKAVWDQAAEGQTEESRAA